MALGLSRFWFLIVDAAIIVLFAVIGRDSHGWEADASETIRIATPFLMAYAAAVLATKAWSKPLRLSTGLVLAVSTLSIGMVLRRLVHDNGTALVFVLVTAIWIIGLMFGWRLAAHGVLRWKRSKPASS
ncbi:MAG: DUF3054 domain-containing protein [Actinomycetota bacterium]|nr:DUF3054 domain-containing protein [Actinomycetota bacterium]